MTPDEIRDIARAAFAGQPAKADGTLALSVGRNPWRALDDALAAVQPHIAAHTLRDFADWLDKNPAHSVCAGLAREQADLIAGGEA
jgi:hypothetical protein